ncbi:MAG: 2-succinyl-6-hydroxy-2,4-cyclohexadiene-1-carboxylate synthase [Anaerolineae bacterium]|jgi:2-succinyl-6-hydroxy-2,4-cyclohexadiene-1-carboxylate synthase|nr:2-succinyl-6-hydroxy-2,4-cyclohexadiene-1-carboxylate synthase [Anaerolineae bacterium]MBT7070913.1 2-succinyl-6-hydroxy-2,4-cyclohexadiene-1-carboxylate synthase [Anaerolineae bacterium]MBT7324339.1 2-succinyl-6-hydroxy-2,4-cyclohexadiene-1-carboxylate synthase [Anaerolineae bacterium]
MWTWQTLGDSSLPPLVFLHGFMGTGADWTEIAAPLSDRFHCLMPDLPGHGETPLDEEPAYAAWASALRDRLSAQGIDHLHLVGYSMGGRLALYFALTYPEMIEKLVLESANPGIIEEIERSQRVALDDKLAALIRQKGMKEFLGFWYSIPLFASLNRYPALKAELIHKRAGQHPESMARILSELSPGRQLELWSRLDEINVPTLLVAGELDEKYSGITHKMEGLISKNKRMILPACGHNTHLEEPVKFLTVLCEWF